MCSPSVHSSSLPPATSIVDSLQSNLIFNLSNHHIIVMIRSLAALARPTMRIASSSFSSSSSRIVRCTSIRCMSSSSSSSSSPASTTASSTPPPIATVDSADSHSDFAPLRKPQRSSTSIIDARAQISNDITSHDVFLYMKGTPTQPRCGFSANVVKILASYPSISYGSRDVLEDDYVRETIKTFSDWPTLPQLFVKGEFVGGSDIVSNMFKSGELEKLLAAQQTKQ